MLAITALRVYIIYFDIFKLLIRIIPFLQQSLCPLEEWGHIQQDFSRILQALR